MSFLLSHSADPNLLSIPGRLRRAPSALITAAVVKDGADAIRTLLDHGAVLEPNIIHCAIEASCRWRNIDKEHGCAERVRLLIDAAKETAKGREEGVKWYLNYLDLKKKGTPLHCAVWWQRLETVQVLVGEGADVGVLCRGMTVAQAARRRAEMVGGHESATRIWEWLTGRRWEDGEGIEEMDEEGSTFKDEVEVELETGETVYRSGNIGRPPRLDEESLALTIKLTLSGHLA